MDWLTDAIDSIVDGINSVVDGAVEGVRKVVEGVEDAIKEVAKAITDAINRLLEGLWNALKSVLNGVWDGINRILDGLWQGIKKVTEGIGKGLSRASTPSRLAAGGLLAAAVVALGFAGTGSPAVPATSPVQMHQVRQVAPAGATESEKPPQWYYLEMRSDAPCHAGVLPKPKKETVGKKVLHYVNAFDSKFADNRTVDNEALVEPSSSTCPEPPASAPQPADLVPSSNTGEQHPGTPVPVLPAQQPKPTDQLPPAPGHQEPLPPPPPAQTPPPPPAK